MLACAVYFREPPVPFREQAEPLGGLCSPEPTGSGAAGRNSVIRKG
ncbi:hypothetical protein AS9A_1749 [Hoyosella subflava DQS3-9A1]|uniref:Uncharacterized protein n=1 Tax=Hoyosella subflava (strain DSM 45089 / JCM 17490 / NBRC 109087 / DQS3-9A1) TaxID=443218 RepID=F6EKR2_HOYSD|nr:hypothetical protein AS9A_1749 [Hoyosella subflava DQS3-9A1]